MSVHTASWRQCDQCKQKMGDGERYYTVTRHEPCDPHAVPPRTGRMPLNIDLCSDCCSDIERCYRRTINAAAFREHWIDPEPVPPPPSPYTIIPKFKDPK